jgi:hypothetical protein
MPRCLVCDEIQPYRGGAGCRTHLRDPQVTVMAGKQCATVSSFLPPSVMVLARSNGSLASAFAPTAVA